MSPSLDSNLTEEQPGLTAAAAAAARNSSLIDAGLRVNSKKATQDSTSPFRVDAVTGAITITVPTVSPSGRDGAEGLTPNPELIYNSLSGNGPFGIGWTLAHSGISRKTSQHVPTYTDEDVFVLAGAEDLVPTPGNDSTLSRYGYEIQQYRPRVQLNATGIRIERWTSCVDATDQFWRTLTDTGLVTLYGRTSVSRIFDPMADQTNPRIFSWLPVVMYDMKGNSTTYRYKEEDSVNVDTALASEQHRTSKSRTAQRYLKSILYCNKTPFQNHDTWVTENWDVAYDDYLFEVILDYGEHASQSPSVKEVSPWLTRADVLSSYHAGFEIRTYRLCRRILLFHRFPHIVTQAASLMSSSSLQYCESASGSTLVSVTHTGYRCLSENGDLHSESLPPLELGYSSARLVPDAQLFDEPLLPITVDTSQLEAIPQGGDSHTQWIDINGEGSPGILARHIGGEWIYLRNESQGCDESSGVAFGPPKLLQGIPAILDDGESGFFTHLAADGMLQFVHLDSGRSIHGYYARNFSNESWGSFVPFAQIPTTDLSQANVHWLDLVGNGRQDAVEFLVDDQNRLRWYPSLGYDGFASARYNTGPHVPQYQSNAFAMFLVDMTGDGLVDVVHVSNWKVCYWPNLGYGRFGARVQMDNSPIMDTDDLFTAQRVLLADLDGSGSADMIYLTPGGGANIYLNQSGNGWTSAVFVASVPELSSLSSINVVDLKGQGVPCLCWTFLNSHGSGAPVLQYLEIMGHILPNRLTNYFKDTVLETSIEYSPSTKFYLTDEKAGQSWTTHLPFPVQCVHTISTTDHVAKTKSTSRYAYHDGFYDSFEREFRGFGHVDCWETEDLAATPGLLQFRAPPRHSRTWYYTGSPLCEASPDRWNDNEIIQLGVSQMPNVPGDSVELREARRAMKGLTLRTEVFGEENSTVLEICQRNYTVLMEQAVPIPGDYNPLVEPPHACFRVLEREVLRKRYEGHPIEEDACVHHQVNLAANQNGQPTKSAAIYYGRRNVPSELDEKTRSLQKQTVITYLEHDYTNPLNEPDALLSPQTAEIRSYKVCGVQAPSESRLFSYDQLSGDDSTFFHNLPVIALEQYPGPASTTKCKTMIAQERSYYRSNDMSAKLALGQIEKFSVLDQSYTLALTAECLEQVLVDENNSSLLSGFSPTDGGYLDLDKNGNWWIPHSKARYSDPKMSWDAGSELSAAQSHFYIPEYTVNAHGAVSFRQLDSFNLLGVKSVDPVGNEISYEYDYPFRDPVKVIDSNDNVTEFAYDCFGTLVGTAVKGKTAESLGDSLEGFKAILDETELAFFVDSPLEAAPKLLGAAGSRIVYSRSGSSNNPTFRAQITRSTHSSSAPALGEFSIRIEYFDGRGNVTQQAVLHTTSEKPQWRLEGWQISSTTHNQAILNFLPCFNESHRYRCRINDQSELPPAEYLIYDPLDRLVAALQPDHSWSTTAIKAWETFVKDAGDNVLVKDITSDGVVGRYIAAALTPESYLPTWYSKHAAETASKDDKAAAQKSEIYSETPDVVYLDPQGQGIQTVTSDNSTVRQTSQLELDAAGNVSAVFDTLGRVVCKSKYDSCQRRIFQEKMDGRVDLALPDATGLEWLRWALGEDDNRFRVENDDAGRPNRVWLLQGSQRSLKEELIIHHEYGEGQPNDKKNNLRGQLYRTLDQAGLSTCMAYDFKGNLARHDTTFATNYRSILDWASIGTHISEELQKESFTDYAIYDAQSRPYQTVAADGSRIARTYNVSGQLDSLQASSKDEPSWTKYITSIKYTASGQRKSISYGNGVTTYYTYDPLTLLETGRQVWKQGRGSKVVFRDIRMVYDCLGKQVYQEDQAQQDVYFRNKVIRPINDHTYDARGQLVVSTGREKINAEGNTSDPYGPWYAFSSDLPSDDQLCEYTDNISYDHVGNITQMQHVPNDEKVSGWTRTYGYGSGNRLIQTKIGRLEDHYSYNARGCMISMPSAVNMEYDYADRLRCSISQRTRSGDGDKTNTPETTWYVYNAAGTRVRKITERAKFPGDKKSESRLRETLYLSQITGFEVYREFSGQGQVKTEKKTLEVTTSLPFSDSSPVALVEHISTDIPSGKLPSRSLYLERYLLDQGLEVDNEGKLLSFEEYSPYGATTFRATNKKRIRQPPPYRYSNYIRDTEETGLYFCQTRYYAPWLGRWTSSDPLGIADGLNMYRYVSNDPINFKDSCGTMQQPCIGGEAYSGGGAQAGGVPERLTTPASGANFQLQRKVLDVEKRDVDFQLIQGQDKDQIHLWSSMVEFSGELSPEELTAACHVAFNQMNSDFKQRQGTGEIRKTLKPPGVMTAYSPSAKPSMVIFSSSAKSITGPHSPRVFYESASHPHLRRLVNETREANGVPKTSGEGKRTDWHQAGSCGELGAINLAFEIGAPPDRLAGNIVTYGTEHGNNTVMKPCGGAAQKPGWGCTQLVRQAGITPIMKGQLTESATLPTITQTYKPMYGHHA